MQPQIFDLLADCCWLGLGNWWFSPCLQRRDEIPPRGVCGADFAARWVEEVFGSFGFFEPDNTASEYSWLVLSLSLSHSRSLDLSPFLCFSWKYSLVLVAVPNWGSELYRERLVRALAREMQVPLLRLDEDHGFGVEDKIEDDIDDDLYLDEQQGYNRTPKLKKGNILVPFFKVVKYIHCNVSSSLGFVCLQGTGLCTIKGAFRSRRRMAGMCMR